MEELYRAIVNDRAEINGLLTLMELYEGTQEPDLLEAASKAICGVFRMMSEDGIYTPRNVDALSTWLDAVFAKYKQRTMQLLVRATETLAFNTLLQMMRITGSFPVDMLYELVEAIVLQRPADTDLYELLDEAVNSYRDIRYYTLRVACRLCQSAQPPTSERVYRGVFKVISEIVMETDELPLFITASLPAGAKDRSEFTACWLEFLRGLSAHSPSTHRAVLAIVNERVLPYMTKPTLLADYLTDCYNAGGLVSLLALNGLFTLMHKHNLDYPSFFPKLYSLLDSKVFHCRYRKRFCRLLALFMTSTHMPAYIVAAFVKRIARLSLGAPPAVISWIVPFIYNMFKLHPAIRVLIHRPAETTDEFVLEELDPTKCNAMGSSLWEIRALERHYWTGATRHARLFTERLTKPLFALDDHLNGPTYNELIQEELSHRWSKIPPLNIAIPDTIF